MNSYLLKAVGFLIWGAVCFEVLLDTSIRASLLSGLTHNPIAAPAILILTQILFASFILPCSPLAMLAGVLWGFGGGILYSTIATVAASLWTFLLGRYMFREWIATRLGEYWHTSILRLIEKHQWKASLIAHVNPAFPGSSLGYAFGMSSISARSFAFGAVMGTFPLQLIMVGIGHLTSLQLDRVRLWPMLAVVGLILAIVVYRVAVPRLLRR